MNELMVELENLNNNFDNLRSREKRLVSYINQLEYESAEYCALLQRVLIAEGKCTNGLMASIREALEPKDVA